MVSGEDLEIVHSGQAATLEQINPLDRRKVLLDAYWLDGEEKRRDLHVNTPSHYTFKLRMQKQVRSYPLLLQAKKTLRLFLTWEWLERMV